MELQAALTTKEPKPEAFRALCMALQDQNADACIVCEVLECLAAWLRRSTGAAQRMMAEERRHGDVVEAMKKFCNNAEFSRLAVSLIALSCYRSIENAGPFCRAGVVNEVFRAMDLHARDNVVMDLGCEALWRLGERGGAQTIRDAGGIERLAEAMRVHRDNPFLQSNACSALFPLVEAGSPWLGRLIEEAHAAMAAHIGHSPIRRQAERLIRACEDAKDGSMPLLPHTPHQPRANSGSVGSYTSACHGSVDGRSAIRPAFVSNCLATEECSQMHGTNGSFPMTAVQTDESTRCVAPSIEANTNELARSLDADANLFGSQARSWEEWLSAVDDEGHLFRYLDSLTQRFKSPSEVINTYRCSSGHLDPRFFSDLGVKRIGHRRLFEVWFRDHFCAGA